MASTNQRRFRISKSRGDWEVLSGVRHILVPVRPKAGNDNFFSSSPLENAMIFRKGFRKEWFFPGRPNLRELPIILFHPSR